MGVQHPAVSSGVAAVGRTVSGVATDGWSVVRLAGCGWLETGLVSRSAGRWDSRRPLAMISKAVAR